MSMFEIARESIQYGAHTLTLETGHVARQASGSVISKDPNRIESLS